MTLVYVTTCPDCEWRHQKLELPPNGEEEACACCGNQFAPEWQAEEHEDLPVVEDFEPMAEEPQTPTPAEFPPQTEPAPQREPEVTNQEVTQAIATTKQPETKPLTQKQGNILIMLLLIGLGMPFWGKLKPQQDWEYLISSGNSDNMNMFGRLGYELVSARWSKGPLGDWSYECIYKRPLRK